MWTYIKHQRGPHNTWLEQECTIHIAHGERPLCRNGRPDAPADGCISSRGWRCLSLPAQSVSCHRCLRVFDRDAIETTLAECEPVQPRIIHQLA